MNKYSVIESILDTFKCQVRIKLKDDNFAVPWAKWFIVPSPGYVELSSCGPVPLREVEWIEINPIETIKIGRLVKDKQVNHLDKIISKIEQDNVDWQIVDNLIRVY